MPKSCAALRCGNRYNSQNKELTFHRFPFSKPELLKEWVENVGRVDFKPKLHTVICSKHFTPECFSPFGNRKNLKHNAVPTIFNNCVGKAKPTPSEKQNSITLFQTVSGNPRGNWPTSIVKRPKDSSVSPSQPAVEPDSATVEIVVELEDESPCPQADTNKDMEVETQTTKLACTLQQQPFVVPTLDHSYAIKDCNSLKKRFFQMLEQNRRLRRQVKMKTLQMRRMSATLWVVKDELRKLKAQVGQGHENKPHSDGTG